MTHLEHAEALRADAERHYNCFQSALLPFSTEYGLDEETACRLGTFFNSGMNCGSICGAVAGALAALGLSGVEGRPNAELLRRFREKNGSLTCPELLRMAAERGEPRKAHCDRMVFEAVQLAEEAIVASSIG